MNEKIITFELDYSDLNFSIEEIEFYVWQSKKLRNDHFRPIIQDLLVIVSQKLDIRCGILLLKPNSVKIEKSEIIGQNFVFRCRKIIAQQLKGSTSLGIFLATLGNKFDRISRKYFEGADPFSGFIIDAMGSVLVEKTADWLEVKLPEISLEKNAGFSNRFSPGYCGWDVREQQILFNLLPTNFCGVRLTESSLMIPIKSVSGIIGIGENLVKQPYYCSFCHMENCYRRNKDFVSE